MCSLLDTLSAFRRRREFLLRSTAHGVDVIECKRETHGCWFITWIHINQSYFNHDMIYRIFLSCNPQQANRWRRDEPAIWIDTASSLRATRFNNQHRRHGDDDCYDIIFGWSWLSLAVEGGEMSEHGYDKSSLRSIKGRRQLACQLAVEFDGAGPRSIRYLNVGINTQLRKKLNSTSNRCAQLPIWSIGSLAKSNRSNPHQIPLFPFNLISSRCCRPHSHFHPNNMLDPSTFCSGEESERYNCCYDGCENVSSVESHKPEYRHEC